MNEVEHSAARMICAGFEGTSVPDSLRELLLRGVSSVILFSRNYESPAQLADLCRQIKTSMDRPVLICIDQEGGGVQRLPEPFTIIPSMREVGRCGRAEQAREIGRVMARELRAVNIDINLAPVLDVDSNPANPVIGERSFGSDPALVAAMGRAMIEGLQSAPNPFAACGKHFPGHGDTSLDSHLDLPRLPHDLQRLRQVELPPFTAAIEAGVAAIMTAHVLLESLDQAHPATMSARIIDGLLRREMGFDGVVISDDMEMKAIAHHCGIDAAVTQGAVAGVDLFLICREADLHHQAIEALMAAVRRRELSPQRIEQANRRLDRLFDRFVRPAHPWTDRNMSVLGCDEHRAVCDVS